LPVRFDLVVSPVHGSAVIVELWLDNTSDHTTKLRVTSPDLQNMNMQGQRRPMTGVVPQEAAGVAELFPGKIGLGMPLNEEIGLPIAMNTMELASLHDVDTGAGIYFMDAEADLDKGVAPTQFFLCEGMVSGHRLEVLKPREKRKLPATLIGIHTEGGWQCAVDQYQTYHRKNWEFPAIPGWSREQGAIYSFSGSGGGAIYMEYPQQDLKQRIKSFEELPRLLAEAKKLGTNIVYLWDYWEGASEGGRPAYWNKGDYRPRKDLGGEKAFATGIRKIHEQGGRVVLYVEPFIIFEHSEIGRRMGLKWAGRDAEGKLYRQYPENYTMVPCFQPWRNYITNIAAGLVGHYDADGIYLDSWGWQLNWPMQTAEEGVMYSPLEFSLGVLTLARQVRETIRGVKADAVVLGESTSGALGRVWDGGLSADFAWLAAQNRNKILGSPVRYGMPEMNVFSNGRNVAELNQVFAAGHGLALLNANLSDAEYICRLVRIRQQYKHLLIYGQQKMATCGECKDLVAYCYKAKEEVLFTIVNTSACPQQAELDVGKAGTGRCWRDLLHPEQELVEDNGVIRVRVPAGGLMVLTRAGARGLAKKSEGPSRT
jgi:hypothetical protein